MGTNQFKKGPRGKFNYQKTANLHETRPYTVVGLLQPWSSQENPDYPDNSNSDPDIIWYPDN